MATYRIMRIDGFNEDHADSIRELHEDIFGKTAPQVNPEYGWWWLATDGREVVGFCGLTRHAQNARWGYLKRAGVLGQHRGNGLQKRFIRVREAVARQEGMPAIVSDTTDNTASANSLIACGYRLYEPEQPWGFGNTLYWRKRISS